MEHLFRDALLNLRRCYEHLSDELSPIENAARNQLIELCYDIVDADEEELVSNHDAWDTYEDDKNE